MATRATVAVALLAVGLAAADQPAPRPSLAGTASQLLNVPRRGIEATGHAITTAATATLIDRNKRGRDQRRFWVLAIAAIHPAYRLTGFLLLIILAYAVLRVLPEYQASECSALRLGALRLAGIACRAAVQLALSLLAALGALTFAAVTLSRAGLEELKDRDLSDEHLAAAASCAAYEELSEEARLRELAIRGVESKNWRVDMGLSTLKTTVLVNSHTQTVIVAFRGSYSVGDWASNIRRIVPGDEDKSQSFQDAERVARAAQARYSFYRKIWLTGHSRGGNMADLFGRRLGLKSIQINPATWGKLFKHEDEAVESISLRSADLISLLETFPTKGRQVRFRMPKNSHVGLLLLPFSLAALWFSLAYWTRELPRPVAVLLKWLGVVGWICGMLFYLMWMHSVLRFTKH